MREQQDRDRSDLELPDGSRRHRTGWQPPVSNRAMASRARQQSRLPSSLEETAEELGTDLDDVRVVPVRDQGRELAATTEGRRIEVRADIDLADPQGERLLAHETAHVIQQSGDSAGPLDRPGSALLEHEASQFADDVIAGKSPAPPGRATGSGPQHQLTLDDGVEIDVYNPGALSDEERLEGIGQILGTKTTYSTFSPGGMNHVTKISLLTGLWHSFDDRVLEVGRANAGLWNESLDLGAPLTDLPALAHIRTAFKGDVKGLARRYMEGNLASVQEELAALGFRGPLAAHGFDPSEPQRRMEELREQAVLVKEVLAKREELKSVVVGYHFVAVPGLEEIAIEAPFDPSGPPLVPPTGLEEPPLPKYEAVKAKWDESTAILNHLTAISPSLHGMAHQDPEKLDVLVADDEPAAREAVRQTLAALTEKINETMEMVRTDDLDYRDLAPLHAQLFFGEVSMGGEFDWTDSWYRRVARNVLMDHKWNEFWIQIGLTTLGAAAFMFAPLGGVVGAVAFGVGTGTGILQAGMSWENYVDLATAEAAETQAGSGIVAPGSADAALAAAVLDTLFAFLDVVPPVWKAAAGWKASRGWEATAQSLRGKGRAAAVGADLARLSVLSVEETSTVLLRGINEFGLMGAARKAGRTPSQLLAIVDPNSQVAGFLREHLERARMGLPGSTGLGEMSRKTADVAIVAGDPHAIFAAVVEEGVPATIRRAGGWKKLTANLSDDTFIGKRLEMWRDQIYKDLQKEFGADAVIATGSRGSLANDLDITFKGPNASANRLQAREFLAGRIGTSADRIPGMIHGDLFVDPRRIHLYDMIENRNLRREVAKQVAEAERELMWGYALYQAAGNPELEAALRLQMEAAGVSTGAYRPIGPNELATRAQRADALHAEFLSRQAAGATEEELAATAKQAALNQSIINIAEREGYFSGAGVRRQVTEQAKITAKGSVAETSSELFNAMVDNAVKLDKAIADLAVATTPEQVADALRKMGKYGSRLSEVGAVVDPRLVRVNLHGDAVWEELVEDWASIKAMIDERAAVFSPGYMGIPSHQVWSVDLPVELQAMTHRARWALDETQRLHLELIGELRARDLFRTSAEAKRLLEQVQRGHSRFLRVRIALEHLLEYLISQQASELDTTSPF